MDLFYEKEVKSLLKKYNIRPSKGMGQNFLVNKSILSKVIESSDLKPDDTVLEVGPGMGVLTTELAKKVKHVIAVEKDLKMLEILSDTQLHQKNIEIINADILKYQSEIENYKVVANIPYYLTSPLIRKFLEEKNPPSMMVLMIQKEVAQRICSKPPNMSLLAVSVQIYADPKIVSYVKKEYFWPKPKVDSAIIKITNINNKKIDVDFEKLFKIVKAGFSQPRKQLGNNLSKYLKIEREKINQWLLQSNIKPEQRAETLAIKDWQLLTKSFDNIV